MKRFLFPLLFCSGLATAAPVEQLATDVEGDVIQWRRHFHEHAELSNREFKTAKYISEYLQALGLQVQTGVAKTGVVAVLDSGRPGPTVALRADMDGLPVVESADLPFASKVKATYGGKEVGVMHACGHDTHMAMLMGAAKVLVESKSQLRGKVKFIFQPAEEGAPIGERGGAEVMVEEGVMKGVDVVFGLHISSKEDVNTVGYRSGGIMAAVDPWKIIVKGKQAHGAYPWSSVDPVVTSAQIVMGLQTIVSRELKLLTNAAVVTVGSINGGNRTNIIPNEVEMTGTVRSLDPVMRANILEAIRRKATSIAESMNAEVEISLPWGQSYPVTYNDPALMDEMMPSLVTSAGADNVRLQKAQTGAEDFSFFQKEVPGLFLFVGGKPLDLPADQAPEHHTPEFAIDEDGLKLGVKLFSNLTLDYMQNHKR